MKSRKVNPETRQLQELINGSFTIKQVMELVSSGANPNIIDKDKRPLLHKIVDVIYAYPSQINECFSAIIDLISIYRADELMPDENGLTVIQRLLETGYFVNKNYLHAQRIAMNDQREEEIDKTLVINENSKLLHDKLNEIVKKRNGYQKILEQRSVFLNTLIMLAQHLNTPASQSDFKKLPTDIILIIVSYLDFSLMEKVSEEAVGLTKEILDKYKTTIKPMLTTPGGINVFQSKGDDNTYRFTFFKSVNTLCLDYNTFKNNLTARHEEKHPHRSKLPGNKRSHSGDTVLKEFQDNYALEYWKSHSSLFKNPVNRDRLRVSIENTDLYKHIKLQNN